MTNSELRPLTLIGAGELGSRHLQALKMLASPAGIDVVDPDAGALARAQTRFAQAPGFDHHAVRFLTRPIRQTTPYEVAIVATRSADRWAAICQLFQNTPPLRVIFEKILFSEPAHFASVTELLRGFGARAWVNCCMRQMPIYRQIRDALAGEPTALHAEGAGFGLMTTAIHYVDYFSWLNGGAAVEVRTDALDPRTVPSKRAGYCELTGTLVLAAANGARGSITCRSTGTEPITLTVENPRRKYVLRPALGAGLRRDRGRAPETFDFGIPYQSTLTGLLVAGLIDRDECPLTPFAESVALHESLLVPVRKFMEANSLLDPELTYPFT